MLNSNTILKFYEKYMILMGIVGHFIFIFQIRTILLNQSSTDVSLEGFLIAFVSIASWLLYGILKKDTVLITVNIFGVLAAIACLIAIIFMRV